MYRSSGIYSAFPWWKTNQLVSRGARKINDQDLQTLPILNPLLPACLPSYSLFNLAVYFLSILFNIEKLNTKLCYLFYNFQKSTYQVSFILHFIFLTGLAIYQFQTRKEIYCFSYKNPPSKIRYYKYNIVIIAIFLLF